MMWHRHYGLCCLFLLLTAALLAQTDPPLVSIRGTLKSIDGKHIVLAIGEEESATFKRTRKTRFLKGTKEVDASAIPAGSRVIVEARKEFYGYGDTDAIHVILDQ